MENIEVPSDILRIFKESHDNSEFSNKNLERIQEHLGEHYLSYENPVKKMIKDKG